MFSVEGKSRKNPLYSLPGDLGVDEPHLELAGHDESDLGQPAGEGEEPDEVPRDVLALLALGPPAVINKQFSNSYSKLSKTIVTSFSGPVELLLDDVDRHLLHDLLHLAVAGDHSAVLHGLAVYREVNHLR